MRVTVQQALEMASTQLRAGQYAQATTILRQLYSEQPDHPAVMLRLGMVLHMSGHSDESLAMFEQMTRRHPKLPDGWNNLGTVLHHLGRLEDSAEAIRTALQVGGVHPDVLANFGGILVELGRPEEAVPVLEQAMAMDPKSVLARSNLAKAMERCGRIDAAIEIHQRAVELAPTDAVLHHYLGLTHLLAGDYQRGWDECEWRCRIRSPRPVCRDYSQPRWDGTELHGKRILIHAEQGLGDTIQFVRYLPMVAARGGRAILQCQPELRALLEHMEGPEQVVSESGSPPPFDVHCPLLSLPYVFKTRAETIPAPRNYLRADPPRIARWSARIDGGTSKLKVGFVWAGKKSNPEYRTRSIPPISLLPLTTIDGVEGFSIQKSLSESEAKLPQTLRITDWTADLTDFAETAAMLQTLDLVISIDTAVAHLAGALGRPVWVLLQYVPDWRWMTDGADSPWYPSARLFRQARGGDWAGVIDRVGASLKELVRCHHEGH